jgi:hypothetical protein
MMEEELRSDGKILELMNYTIEIKLI